MNLSKGKDLLESLSASAAFSALMLALTACLVLLSPPAMAGGRPSRTFLFNDPAGVRNWRFDHVSRARLTRDGLALRGSNYVRIAPPSGFTFPARRLAMEVEFWAPKSIVCNLRVKASNGWVGMKTLRAKILDGSDGRARLDFYLGKVGGRGVQVQDFVLEFYSTENVVLRLQSIRLYEPTTAEVASLLWEEFWRPDFITGATVGFVTTPSAGPLGFLSILYILMAVLFTAILIIWRTRGGSEWRKDVTKAVVVVIASAGILFALRMDYNWLVIWRDDLKTLTPVGVDERLRIVYNHNFDSFLDFISFVKESVPPGQAVRPATLGYDTPLAAIARYYMLPLEHSASARYLWSYGEVLYTDPATSALRDSKGRLIAPRARLFARFATNAALYEVY